MNLIFRISNLSLFKYVNLKSYKSTDPIRKPNFSLKEGGIRLLYSSLFSIFHKRMNTIHLSLGENIV
ncbi:hypothetical protein BK130_21190 [Viridibacillus sp. FSL H8-0123]|nr:hypothetical protein BK130_21190 [Viridibacillus sp. FSL H8-0123]OMC81285.1 hypothetical protein BK128_22090 [Viridibacillus sp. FSL H7-0596]OMC87047.1 hypothetical protein BK137_21165 [Viridibacillus arenosi]